MSSARATNPFRYFKTSPEVIRLAVMLYVGRGSQLDGRSGWTADVRRTDRTHVMQRSMHQFGTTLEYLALLSQVAGAAAVFASLIFVGFQIRGQTNATRAQTEQAIAANWMALAQVIGGSAEAFTRGIVSTDATFADLNDADRMRFLTVVFALFKHYENMYLQFGKGRVSEAEWEPWSNHIQMYFHQPGVQTWWGLRRATFSPTFQDFLDHSIAPRELSPAALHHAAENRQVKR